MSTVSKSFEAAGVSALLSLKPGESLSYEVSGTFVGTVVLEQSDSPGTHFKPVTGPAVSKTAAAEGTRKNETAGALWYRWRCSAYTSGTIVTVLADASDTQPAETGPSGTGGLTIDDEGINTDHLDVDTVTADAITMNTFEITSTLTAADGTGSFQPGWIDLTIEADAGSDDDEDPAFLGAFMGNVFGDDVAGEGNYIGGVIGALSVTGTKSSLYPVGALVGIVSDGVTEGDGAVVAEIDGDSEVTRVNAMFKAMMRNSVPGSGADYGMDLYDTGPGAYEDIAYAKADIRITGEICILSTPGAPVDYTDGDPVATGEGYAGIGSICIRRDTGKMYVNGGTKAEPLWKLVTSA